MILPVQPLFRAACVALCLSRDDSGASSSDAASSPQSVPRVDSVTTVSSTKWLALQTLLYTDQDGKSREWDVVSRTTKQSRDKADAVVIIPLLRRKGSSKVETLLVDQYRPPVGRLVTSFPAGLIDKDESPGDAALRELREETGYVGDMHNVVPLMSPELGMSPGMSDASAHCVLVNVDLDDPLNHGSPVADPDEGEFIAVKRVTLNKGLRQVLDNEVTMPHMGLYLFSLGLELGMMSVC